MCRMFFQCSIEPFNIEYKLLKKFISSCHWHYLRKYNLFGHHGLGWGFAYIPEHNSTKLIIKRDITAIYKADWKNLTKIKTRFLLVHARKTLPWKKKLEDVHPINIGEKYIIAHNGIIKNSSFPNLHNPRLEQEKKRTDLDTRKYLCFIIDKLKDGLDLKETLETVFSKIVLGAGANAFLFNLTQCNVISYHNSNFNGRHHTLFLKKENNTILVSTTPLRSKMKEIPNQSLIQIDLGNLLIKMNKLDI